MADAESRRILRASGARVGLCKVNAATGVLFDNINDYVQLFRFREQYHMK